MCARPTYGSRGRILVDVFFRLSHQARVQTEAPGGTAAPLPISAQLFSSSSSFALGLLFSSSFKLVRVFSWRCSWANICFSLQSSSATRSSRVDLIPRCRTPRSKSAASGCASPISPCSGARDGRRPRRGTSKAHACMHEFNIWSSLVPRASCALSRSRLPCSRDSGTCPSLSHTMDLDFMRSSESRLRISGAHFKAGRCYHWCPPPCWLPSFQNKTTKDSLNLGVHNFKSTNKACFSQVIALTSW